ncbi:MgtC/SapB family protein [Chromobacterium sp. IIBBL 290-4]|uniref:MgtC/SapB family protein n=1 Tax=Chromobacterium sp. IIBBL 290-4 TaxID=2953890 RepID=UPI0020B8DB97|nr:MgtC/SapB family protein [Chromobacterium sp. IIBBL 290-4]UTH75872.1 MgtC/SapB family protein [Chromobacterium sp. IIBBL 290-4]
MRYPDWLPPEATQITLALFLSFLIGLEREERQAGDHYAFGGVRTYPLIALIGYGIAVLSDGQLLPVALGFAVIAAFLLLSYWHKLGASGYSGVTTEMSGLATYLIGVLVCHQLYWLATTLTVASLLLLEFKTRLEGLARRIDPADILTLTQFLLLAAVILPLLPDEAAGRFAINPFKTWLVVVAVSAVSYGSYLLQRLRQGKRGLLLSALAGGAYSSTVTTFVLARRSVDAASPRLYSGAILMASGMMYLRLMAFLALFNPALLSRLWQPFSLLAALALLGGAGWARSGQADTARPDAAHPPKNPLEIGAALMFALLFIAMLAATRLAAQYLGSAGVYALAAVMGVSDVDPFIMSITQSTPQLTPLSQAAAAILIATSANNLAKGVYALSLGSRAAGRQSLALLLALAALGLSALLWG